jgi:tetratricopeptide (TPR) repeat protein
MRPGRARTARDVFYGKRFETALLFLDGRPLPRASHETRSEYYRTLKRIPIDEPGGGCLRPRGSCILVAAAWIACLLAAPPASAGLPVQEDPAVEAAVDSLVRAAVDLTFSGRLDLGLQAVDLAEAYAPRDPRIGITRFRLLREDYPVGVYQKDRAREQAPALIAVLDHTIAVCDSMIDLDEENAAAYLYRAWAYINLAQTQLIARELRAAAGASRHGKGDFDKFYEYHPQGDPDAATILGAYLYYADTVPSFFKFFRWLLRVPGGDRERGLELLREGAAGDGYTKGDAKLVLAVTHYLFDGNLEEARNLLDEEIERFPHYPRVVEFACSMSFVYREKTESAVAAETAVLDGWNETTRGWGDAVWYRLRWSRARLLRQLGRYDDALAEMVSIVDESPRWPEWMVPFAHLAAVELAADVRAREVVDRLCETVPDEERYDALRKSVRKACWRRESEAEAAAFRDLGAARQAVYGGRADEAAVVLGQTVAAHGVDVHARFLEAEIARYEGHLDDALEMYSQVVEEAEHDGAVAIGVQALQSMAEIYLGMQKYDRAKDCYEKARDLEPEETMLSNTIRGRIRYIERTKD